MKISSKRHTLWLLTLTWAFTADAVRDESPHDKPFVGSWTVQHTPTCKEDYLFLRDGRLFIRSAEEINHYRYRVEHKTGDLYVLQFTKIINNRRPDCEGDVYLGAFPKPSYQVNLSYDRNTHELTLATALDDPDSALGPYMAAEQPFSVEEFDIHSDVNAPASASADAPSKAANEELQQLMLQAGEALHTGAEVFLGMALQGVDETLEPEVAALLARPVPDVLEDNGWIYQWGMDRYPDEVYATGLAMHHALSKDQPMRPRELNIKWSYMDVPSSKDLGLCSPLEAACLVNLLNDASGISDVVYDYRLWHDRYLQFLKFEHFSKPFNRFAQNYINEPSFSPLMIGESLQMYQTIHRWERHPNQRLTQSLLDEFENLKRVFRNTDQTFQKLLALGRVGRHLELLNLLCQHDPEACPAELMQSRLSELSNADMNVELMKERAWLSQLKLVHAGMMRQIQEELAREDVEFEYANMITNALIGRTPNLLANRYYNLEYLPNSLDLVRPLTDAVQVNENELHLELSTTDELRSDLDRFLLQMLSNRHSAHQMNIKRHKINLRMRLFKALMRHGSVDKLLQAAEAGDAELLSPWDGSAPQRHDGQLCYKLPETASGQVCLDLLP